MQLYPAIDLKDGKCVRLEQGNFNKMTVYSHKPEQVAAGFMEDGATFIHVVDLDGARLGTGYNQDTIKKILEAVNIPVQVGGGIRSMEDIKAKIGLGVSRVILGTAAIRDPIFVKEAIQQFGDKIAIGIDAKNSYVAVSGWEQVSNISALSLCRQIEDIGGKHIIFTDIARDGMMSGVNLESTKELIEATSINIIASGGISSLRDLEAVRQICASGVIIGKALYQGTVKLKEAIQAFQK